MKREHILAEQAKERMLAGKAPDPVETLPQGQQKQEAGKTRDIAGARAGVSGKTYEKGKHVFEHADEDRKEKLRRLSS